MGRRGDRRLAHAVFYWFFTEVPEPSYFREIARHVWPKGTDLFKRFIYAKGGDDDDRSRDAIAARFSADMREVRRGFERLWIDEEHPFNLELPARSSQIYHYTSGAISIIGRRAEQDALRRFRDAGPGFRWWQIAGVAGQGKSRLALDLIQETLEHLPEWQAGFLSGDSAAEDFARACAEWTPTRPYLIVIDYVLTRTGPLKQAIEALKSRHGEFDVPVCLLLVERQPWNVGGYGDFGSNRADWFIRICASPVGQDAALDELRYHDGKDSPFDALIELEALAPERLVEIVREIAADQKTEIVESDEAIQRMLANLDSQGRPLYAYFLAKALAGGALDAAADAEALLDWVLQTDRARRWTAVFRETVPGIGSEAPDLPNYPGRNPAMQLAILATIIGELDCNRLPGDLGWTPHNRDILRQAILIADNPLQDDPEPGIVGLQPDLLGEWFVLRSVERQRGFEYLIDLSWQLAPEKTAEFLERATRDFPDRAATTVLLDRLPKESEQAALNAYAASSPTQLFHFHRAGKAPPVGVIAMLDRAANSGSTIAMFNLGTCYLKGNGVEQNLETALACFRRGAAAGNGRAMMSLGNCFQQGTGVEQNLQTALAWYRKGAAAGDGQAMAALGVCYKKGIGVEQDFEAALSWCRKGAATGDGRAMVNLGDCYAQGVGVQENHETAVAWYRRGAAAGSGHAMASLGTSYRLGAGVEQNLDTALAWYRRGAAAADGHAMANLGNCYRLGTGVEQNLDTALAWYRKGAAADDGSAMGNLGVCYEKGIGVERNVETALKWCRKAVLAGDGHAMANLGVHYALGIGVEQDLTTALEWYRKGASAGDGHAMANLGDCYRLGAGVEQNLNAALEWYGKGAAVGNGVAMDNLGLCYEHGKGVEQNLETALEWYRKGAVAGNERSRHQLIALCVAIEIAAPFRPDHFVELRVKLDGSWLDPPLMAANWRDVSLEEADEFAQILVHAAAIGGVAERFEGKLVTALRSTTLTFYPGLELIDAQLETEDSEGACVVSALVSASGAVLLDGTFDRLHPFNAARLDLSTEEAQRRYLRFVCSYVRGPEGPFQVVEHWDDVPFEDEIDSSRFADRSINIAPMEVCVASGDLRPQIKAAFLYGPELNRALFVLSENGLPEIQDPVVIVSDLKVRRRQYEGPFRMPLMPRSGAKKLLIVF